MEQKEFETEIGRIRRRMLSEAQRYLEDGDEAEDVTQDAVLKLWSMRQQLDAYQSVEALAIVMVRRLALSKKRTRVVPMADYTAAEAITDETPESQFVSQEEEAKVLKLLATLPDAQQAVLRMKHVDGLETSEIASITGSSEEAVRKNLSRARKKIMEMFLNQ